ncbi:MAG: EF-P lysine aminoacylase EpmA [Oceanococcus sp.]
MSNRRPWEPAATLSALRFRADLVARIRRFFHEREVLEVATPALSMAAATDPQIESFQVPVEGVGWWLQTSPEFHMKRLLAAGSGPIYQMATAFRCEEQGRWHNAEFTMLEWYRPHFDHHQLMDEVAELWAELADQKANFPRFRYVDLIEQQLGLPWDDCDAQSLRAALQAILGDLPADLDRNGLLDAAMGLLIGPGLGQGTPCFVYDFPPEQAALARLRKDELGQDWACRFELYWQGHELANGFYELCDATEQQQRFEHDLTLRRAQGQATPPMDACLLDALQHGLPDCAGVAFGIDRLCALLMGAPDIQSVLSFPTDRA